MDGEENGAQQSAANAQGEAQGGVQTPQGAEPKGSSGAAGSGAAPGGDGGNADAAAGYEAQIAERDKKIADLEAQMAEAAKSAEAAASLKAEIEGLKAQGESDRKDFALALAGAKNVKAARALLDEHDGDVEKLKAAEPWLFSEAKPAASAAAPSGATGLPNAGAASDEGRDVKRWRKIAGLDNE